MYTKNTVAHHQNTYTITCTPSHTHTITHTHTHYHTCTSIYIHLRTHTTTHTHRLLPVLPEQALPHLAAAATTNLAPDRALCVRIGACKTIDALAQTHPHVLQPHIGLIYSGVCVCMCVCVLLCVYCLVLQTVSCVCLIGDWVLECWVFSCIFVCVCLYTHTHAPKFPLPIVCTQHTHTHYPSLSFHRHRVPP